MHLDLSWSAKTFIIITCEGFVDNFDMPLLELIAREAPGVQFSFMFNQDKYSESMRDGNVDLKVSVIDKATELEVRTQALLRNPFVGSPGPSMSSAAAKSSVLVTLPAAM